MENSTYYSQSSHEKEASSSSASPSAFYQEAPSRPRQNKTKELLGTINYHWFTSQQLFMGRRRWCLQPWLEQVLICFAYQVMVLDGLESVSSYKKKKWCIVLFASIFLCDEDVTLLFVCHPVPCRRKGG